MSLSCESELDKYFGHSEGLIIQGRMVEQPIFSSAVLYDASRSIFRQGMEIVRNTPETKGFQTNITQIEFLYPWILRKLGLIKVDLPEKGRFSPMDAATTLGDKLHQADILFNLIVDGVDAVEIAKRLPNHKPKEIARFQVAMEGLAISESATRGEIEEKLVEAWNRYHQQRGFFQNANLPFAGWGLVNPEAQEAVFYGGNVERLGILLAKSWADYSTRANPLTWEFELEAYTQRELLTVMNFNLPKLQFIARLDSISRFGRTKKLVKSQIIDLKTGRKIEHRGLAKDVEIRQGQVTRVAAERFTSHYLRGEKSLEPRDTAFYCRADHTSRAHLERLDMAGYRRFNKETGAMEIEPIEMTDAGRQEFNNWFSWYGAMVHLFRADMERLRKQKIQYDLTGISLSELDA